MLVGTEASTPSGHVLGLGIPDPVFRFSGDARDALATCATWAASPSPPIP